MTTDYQEGNEYTRELEGYLDALRRSGRKDNTMIIHGKGHGTKGMMTTHSFRRFFGTSLYYEAHTDLQTVKNLMRHANVATTLKCYVEASDIREREAMGKLMSFMSPLF